MKKYVPLALSAAALAAAVWWATSTVGDDEAGAAAPPLVPVSSVESGVAGPDASKPPALSADRAPPILKSRPAPPPPPAERIVPESRPVSAEDGTESGGGTQPPRAEPDAEKPAAPSVLRQGAHGFEFLGGPGAAARATRDVRVRGGRAVIGSSQGEVNGVRSGAAAGTHAGLQLEVPRHTRELDEFWIGRFEITNQQYWQYLNHSAGVIYDTSDFPSRNLVEIANALVQPAPANLDIANVTARQLYEANKTVLLKLFPADIFEDTDGRVDEDRTWLHIRKRVVPSGLRLNFFERPPPGTWPSDRFLEYESDHPVRDVSIEEAIDYAMWIGRHIPSEIEWEYAARGPKGSPFPWGPRATGFTSRVNGGRERKRGERPETVPSHHLAAGASWVGCFNMLGNVSEWTSSWNDLYPGGSAPARFPVSARPVVRGGSAFDQDRNVVRLPFRGWSRADPEGEPMPNTRRRWTGFRTARYDEPGRSRIPAMQYAVRRGGRLHHDAFLPHTYEAWVGALVVSHDRFFDPEDPDIRPGVKTFTCQPLRAAAFRLQPIDPLLTVHSNTSGLVPPPAGQPAPFVVGIFENGIKLVSTWEGTPRGLHAMAAPGRFVRSACPPGVWLVGTLHERLVLIRPDFRRVFYLNPRGRLVDAVFRIRDRKPPKNPERGRSTVSLSFDPHSARIDLRLEVPLGPSGEPFARVVRLRMRAEAFLRDVAHVTRWSKGSLR